MRAKSTWCFLLPDFYLHSSFSNGTLPPLYFAGLCWNIHSNIIIYDRDQGIVHNCLHWINTPVRRNLQFNRMILDLVVLIKETLSKKLALNPFLFIFQYNSPTLKNIRNVRTMLHFVSNLINFNNIENSKLMSIQYIQFQLIFIDHNRLNRQTVANCKVPLQNWPYIWLRNRHISISSLRLCIWNVVVVVVKQMDDWEYFINNN